MYVFPQSRVNKKKNRRYRRLLEKIQTTLPETQKNAEKVA